LTTDDTDCTDGLQSDAITSVSIRDIRGFSLSPSMNNILNSLGISVSRRTALRHGARLALGVAAMRAFHIHVHGDDARKPWRTGNETIDKPRTIALDLLKPMQAQIEHAWELHFGSTVFESYGFAPRCAVDGARIQEAMLAGASGDELLDMREEMMMNRNATNERERREFLDAFHAVGVTCIFQNAGEEGNDPLKLIKRLAHFTKATDLLRPELSKVVTAYEVAAVKESGKRSRCASPATACRSASRSTAYARTSLRPHLPRTRHPLMHLTYNRRNAIGDGAGESHDGGLSDFGRETGAELNRTGVIVDVAHSGWQTALDAAKASTKPMVASHTACTSLYKHFRGKPDDTIRAICDTGGLVGICCIPRFLNGKGDIGAFLDHLDHLVKKFGGDHAAIGTDVAYVSCFEKEERLKVAKCADGKQAVRRYRGSLEAPVAEGRLRDRARCRTEHRVDELAALHPRPRHARLRR